MAELPKEAEYCLKAGVVLQPNFGISKFYSLDLPTEVAEDYLRENPARINKFQRYPEDWESRINKTKTPDKAKNVALEASSPAVGQSSMVMPENATEAKKTPRKRKSNKKA